MRRRWSKGERLEGLEEEGRGEKRLTMVSPFPVFVLSLTAHAHRLMGRRKW